MTAATLQDIDDMLYTGGPFRGYDHLGYIGSSQRNYVTDRWVDEAATVLGWSALELAEWTQSRWGRWAMDAEPMSCVDMLREMRRCDIDELLAEAMTDL